MVWMARCEDKGEVQRDTVRGAARFTMSVILFSVSEDRVVIKRSGSFGSRCLFLLRKMNSL